MSDSQNSGDVRAQSFHVRDGRSQLSPFVGATEVIGHAWRVRSLTTLIAMTLDKLGRVVLGQHWVRYAYWYAGRLLGGRVALSDGMRLQVNPDWPMYLAGALWLGLYEQKERYAIARLLPRDQPAVEFGAGIGAVTCMTNRLLRRRDLHCAVEANPVAVPTLMANREANGAQFRIVHGALAYGSPVALLDFDSQMIFGSVSARGIEVPAVTLRGIIDQMGFESCTLICDIEGAEFELLRREADVIKRHVPVALMEVHQQLASDIESFWATWHQMGYECLEVKTGMWMFRRMNQHSEESPQK
jgi:FkbM family methyltransferase